MNRVKLNTEALIKISGTIFNELTTTYPQLANLLHTDGFILINHHNYFLKNVSKHVISLIRLHNINR